MINQLSRNLEKNQAAAKNKGDERHLDQDKEPLSPPLCSQLVINIITDVFLIRKLGVLAKSGKESKHLGKSRRVRARLKGSIGSMGAKDMGAEQRGGRVFMELCISRDFWAIYSAFSVSVSSLYFTPTHPPQAFVTCKQLELLTLRCCKSLGCCWASAQSFRVASTAPGLPNSYTSLAISQRRFDTYQTFPLAPLIRMSLLYSNFTSPYQRCQYTHHHRSPCRKMTNQQ